VNADEPLGRHEGDLASIALALAKRFHHGATMWCVSPTWPHHARHVAVEFVHPVMVGKRALPAVALPPDGLVVALRSFARAGDIVVAIADGADQQVGEVIRRAAAWGLTTVWIGSGERPSPVSADHLLWLDDDEAAVNGRFILLYHLLWELTHVCFEHAGVLAAEVEEGEVCVTCADDGQLAEVVQLHADGHTATVRLAGELREVDTTLIDQPAEHDLLLVHAGSVLQNLDDAMAGRT
jgi:hydrogenase maturation factor